MQTAEHDLQQRVRQLEAELAASRAELQEFTYTVSHDLRAPLRHLVSFARLLEEEAGGQLAGDSAEFLRTISASAAHMGVLLDALTALSRLNSVQAVIAPTPLAPLVDECIHEVVAGLSVPPVAINVSVSPALKVLADSGLVKKALVQVLGNAFKFSAKVPDPAIAVRAETDAHGRVQLQVDDNGAGFSPSMQDKLFKVFGRLHSTKQFSGLGVGLLTAQRLLAKVNAQITLHSKAQGGGAVATLTFDAVKK